MVWFKRDLRIEDHAPLSKAAKQGKCLCLYVYEPELINSNEFDTSHLNFINESLAELRDRLKQIGGQLTLRVGSMPEVLDGLHRDHGIDALWSHEETGNKITFDRDKRVARWAKQHGIPWREMPQCGVVRRLQSRDGWSKQREAFMRRPVATTPESIDSPTGVSIGSIKSPSDLGLPPTTKTELQVGGESVGREILMRFSPIEAKITAVKCRALLPRGTPAVGSVPILHGAASR